MTHDELLAKIAFDSAHHLREALRAVVELIVEPDGQLLVSKALLKHAIERELG